MYDTTEETTLMIQQKPTHPSIPMLAKAALIILTLLLILGSGFLITYATILHPAELKVQATVVVNTIISNQTQAKSTNSPQFLYTQLTNKAPTFNNSMDAPMGGWDTGNIGNSSCTFTDGAYHSRVASNLASFACLNSGKDYSNFAFQVQMTILNGSGGGILLRSPDVNLDGYVFEISTNGFYYMRVVTNTSSTTQRVGFGHSGVIHPGLKQTNLLTVIARGKHLSFYINKQFINSFDDETFSTGFICLVAFNHHHQPATDVAFKDAQLWIV